MPETESLMDKLLPRGRLDPDELPAWAGGPQEGQEDEAAEAGEMMADLAGALEPQLQAEKKERVRREAAAEKAGLGAWLLDLIEQIQAVGEDEEGGRTGLDLLLSRIQKVNGTETRQLMERWTWDREKAIAEGVPDLEGLAMETAKERNWYGAFRWDIKAFVDGELKKAVAQRMHVAPPPGWQPEEVVQTKQAEGDDMKQLEQAFTLMGRMRDVMGGGAGSGGAAAAAEARLEMLMRHQEDLRRIDMEHRAELARVRAEALEEGRAAGREAATRELERKMWELESQLQQGRPEGEPHWIDRVSTLLGGPENVAGLVGVVMSHLGKGHAPQAPVQARQRPAMRPAAPAPAPAAAPAAPATLAAAPAVPLPSVGEMFDAIADLDEAAARLREDDGPDAQQAAAIAGMLEEAAERGRRAVSQDQVMTWWQDMKRPTFPSPEGAKSIWDLVQSINAEDVHDETEEESMPVDPKALLIQRLEEGATAEAIHQEMLQTIPGETIRQWQGMLGGAPDALVMSFLGIPAGHEDTARQLLGLMRG